MTPPLNFKSFHLQTGGGVQAFQRYLVHYANALSAQGANSFRPTPPKVGFGEATHLAARAYRPLIAGQNQLYNSQTTGLTNAITGYGAEMQKYLAPLGNEIKDTYATAGNALSGTNSAVRDIALNQGQGQQSQLARFAQSTDQPVANQGVADASGRTQVAGQVLGALGKSAIDDSALHGEAARLFQLSKPEAFAAMGDQSLSRGLSSLAATNNDNLAKLRAGQADEQGKLYQAFLTRELQKAVAKATYDRGIYATNAGVYKAGAAAAAKKTAAGVTAAGKTASAWKAQHNSFVTKADSLLAAASRPATKTQLVDRVDPTSGLHYTTKVTSRTRQPNYVQTRKQLINIAENLLTGYVNPQTGSKMTTAQARQFAIAYLFASGLYGQGQYGRPGAGLPPGSGIPPDLRPGG